MPPVAIPAASPPATLRRPKGKYPPLKPISRGSLAGLPARPPQDRFRYLLARQAREILNAEAFAENQGVPFAALVTIHWRCDPAFDPARWAKRTTRFLDKLHRWLGRRGFPIAFAYVHEIGAHYGEHTHLLLHLPKMQAAAYQAIRAELEAWIAKTEHLATDRLDPRGKPWPPVLVTPDKPHSFGMRTPQMRGGALSYVLKGLDPDDLAYRGNGAEPRAAAMGIRPKANAGLIEAQRYGASRSLGPKARQEAAWQELTSLEEFHARLKPI